MFKYGKWEIEIDEEKTREYYASLSLENTQSNRNFQKNIDCFSEEERAFFDSLCVDLTKIDVEGSLLVSTYLKKKLHWGCNADVFVWGKIVYSPNVSIITINDVAENGLEILEDRETGEIKIGRFEFEINDPEEWESGEDCPEGAIYISMNYAELDWLLDEKCDNIETEGMSIFTKIKWTLHNLFLGKIEKKKDNKKGAENVIKYFNETEIAITQKPQNQVLAYKKEWVCNYTNIPETAKASLPSRKMHNLLWHVFSFEDGKEVEGDEAQALYDKADRNNVMIYIDDFDALFEASNANKLTSAEIEKLCTCEEYEFYNLDVIITARDFSWTYCRTHESGWCGPYFYHK